MSTGSLEANAIVVRNGQLLDVDTWTTSPQDILIRGDRFEAIERSIEPPPEALILEAAGGLLIPGFINGHTHSQNNLTKGSGDRWTLEMALIFGRALNSRRTTDDHHVSALLGAVEMIRSGITSVYDLFIESPQPTPDGIGAVVAAYDTAGLRAIVAPAVADIDVLSLLQQIDSPVAAGIAVDSKGSPSAEEMLDILRNAGERKQGPNQRVRLAVSPTIPLYCSDELMEGLRDLASTWDSSIHSHLAETKFQAVSSVLATGLSNVERLATLGVLSDRFIGAHGVWLRRKEVGMLAAQGSVIVHNPTSNFKLGSGVANIRQLRSMGVRVALGTDGCLSSDNQNMFAALKSATFASRLRSSSPDAWLGSRDALELAWRGGALAMGLPDSLGKIAPGYLADLVILDADSVHLLPVNDVCNQLVYCETGEAVDTVIVGGRVLMKNKVLVSLDERAVKAEAREARERHHERIGPALEEARARAQLVQRACSEITSSETDDDFTSLRGA
ncbi:MAG: amidohydrolase family protein [Actinomycetota bacterium]